jgi:hypothetical protein
VRDSDQAFVTHIIVRGEVGSQALLRLLSVIGVATWTRVDVAPLPVQFNTPPFPVPVNSSKTTVCHCLRSLNLPCALHRYLLKSMHSPRVPSPLPVASPRVLSFCRRLCRHLPGRVLLLLSLLIVLLPLPITFTMNFFKSLSRPRLQYYTPERTKDTVVVHLAPARSPLEKVPIELVAFVPRVMWAERLETILQFSAKYHHSRLEGSYLVITIL